MSTTAQSILTYKITKPFTRKRDAQELGGAIFDMLPLGTAYGYSVRKIHRGRWHFSTTIRDVDLEAVRPLLGTGYSTLTFTTK